MESFQLVAIVISILGLAASITYYSSVLQNQNKTRQAQLFMNLYGTYQTTEFKNIYTDILFHWEWENYEDWWGKYGADNNPKAFSDWNSIAGYCDGIGVLLKKNLVDIEMIDELLANTVISLWDKMGPNILEARDYRGSWRIPLGVLHMNFEYLYNELVKYRETNQ